MILLSALFFGCVILGCTLIIGWQIAGARDDIVDALNGLASDADKLWSNKPEDDLDEPPLAYVMCGGCGRTVECEWDGFTPKPHGCAALDQKLEEKFHMPIDNENDTD